MKDHPARYLTPSNALTYASLAAGLLALVITAETGSAHGAGALIALSVLMDTLDGRFARLFQRDELQRAFGVQVDSLTDVLTHGFVPVGCLYLLTSFDSTGARWAWCALAGMHVLATVTRLGFYNLHAGDSEGFVGVPAPVIGLVWSSLLLARPTAFGSGALLLVAAVAMVSPLRIPRPRGLGLVVFLGWATVLIVVHALRLAAERGQVP